MNIGIYKITNPKGKIYIGQSTNIKSRKNQYKRLNCKKQPKIYNSIKKYGWEQHKFNIIEECPIEQLNERETFYKQQIINEYGWKIALFCEVTDAHTGGKRSEYTKQKMSKSRLGKKDSEETKKKKRESNLGKHGGKRPEGFGDKISKLNQGKTRSDDTKEKIRNSMTKSVGKHVTCYNLDMSIHKKFPSLNQASREMNLSLSQYNFMLPRQKI